MKQTKKLYSKVLHWAYDKQVNGFTEKELFAECGSDDQNLKDWYVRVFRGGNTDNECLIGHLKSINGVDYWHLTAKGISATEELKEWYEKLLAKIIIAVIIAGIIYWFGWN